MHGHVTCFEWVTHWPWIEVQSLACASVRLFTNILSEHHSGISAGGGLVSTVIFEVALQSFA
jgi:hypothetical protein